MEDILQFLAQVPWWAWVLFAIVLVGIRDVLQKKHVVSHNYPIVGHLRYMLEKIGPELRQYIVANNREELPFNRSQRSWVYASSKRQNNYQGFGTDQDQYAPGHIFINPAMIPFAVKPGHPNFDAPDALPCAKVMGAYNGRKRPYRPKSVINISAMSFGSLSAKAVESMNRGALKAECYHNTGEGSLSPHHQHGADVMFHFGTAYFGVRSDDGNLDIDKLEKLVPNTSKSERLRSSFRKVPNPAKEEFYQPLKSLKK